MRLRLNVIYYNKREFGLIVVINQMFELKRWLNLNRNPTYVGWPFSGFKFGAN
ncbi:MAG: hypothetical protein RJQ00_11625 [Vicingaceae bacterium]